MFFTVVEIWKVVMHNIVQEVHTNNLHLCTYRIFICISLALCCGIINSVLSHFVLNLHILLLTIV